MTTIKNVDIPKLFGFPVYPNKKFELVYDEYGFLIGSGNGWWECNDKPGTNTKCTAKCINFEYELLSCVNTIYNYEIKIIYDNCLAVTLGVCNLVIDRNDGVISYNYLDLDKYINKFHPKPQLFIHLINRNTI
jgi:hypothetical protein